MRFPGFEGEWEAKKLGEVSMFYNGRAYKQSELLNEGRYPVLRVGNLFTNENWYYSDLELDETKYIDDGDLMYAWSASFGPRIWKGYKVIYHYHIWKVEILRSLLDKHFYYILLGNETARMKSSSSNGFALLHITKGTIENWQSYFPSISEQQKVASFLSLIDDRISTQSKIIAQLQTLMQGLGEQLFKQRIRFKDDNGNDFPDWEEKKLGEVYSFRVTNSFSRDDLNYEIGEIKNIHYGDIHTKFQTLFDIAREKVPSINPNISTSRIQEENYCKEGDVVFADASEDLNDIGKAIEIVNLNNEKLLSGLHTILARPLSGKLSIGFGGYLFQAKKIRKQVQKESQGTKVLGISAGRLANVELQLPALAEQAHIANFLSSINEKMKAEKIILFQYESQKKYLLQNMFI